MQFPWQQGCPQPGNFRARLSGGGRCAEQPQSCLPPANEGAGRAGGKGGCLVLPPPPMPSLKERAEGALIPLIIPVTSRRKAQQVA